MVGRRHQHHQQPRQALLAAWSLLLARPTTCYISQLATFTAACRTSSGAGKAASARPVCSLAAVDPDIQGDIDAYPTMEEQLAAMQPARPVRRAPVRRRLTLQDLDSGFAGFDDEIEAERTLQQQLVADAVSPVALATGSFAKMACNVSCTRVLLEFWLQLRIS
jgi:hypothetical protein